jgi:hypothetical protein
MFPEHVVPRTQLPTHKVEPTSVVYGNHSESTIDHTCDVGTRTFLVDPNCRDTYFATNDLVGGSNKVVFSQNDAYCYNNKLHKTKHMYKDDDDLWRLSLVDMIAVSQWPYDEMLNDTTHINARVINKGMSKHERDKMLLRLIRLHNIYDHPPIEIMWKAIKYGHWLNSGIDPSQIRMIWKGYQCPACIMAKSNKIPKSINTDKRNVKIGEIISGDPVEVNIPGVDGDAWIFLFVDLCTSYWTGSTSKTKIDFCDILRQTIEFYISQGHTPQIFRSDNENLLKDAKIMDLLKEFNMVKQSSAPYQHYQCPVERHVQTMIKQISCVLHAQSLLKARWWNMIFNHCLEMHNRVPNTATGKETPISMVMKAPSYKHTNVANTFNFTMGELVAVGIAKEHREWKFDTKRQLGIYVGQPIGQVDSHYIYMPYVDTIYARADVIPINIPPADLAKFYLTRANMKQGKSSYQEVAKLARAVGIASDTQPGLGFIGPQDITHVPEAPERMGTRNRPAAVVAATTIPDSSHLSHSTMTDTREFDQLMDQCGRASGLQEPIPDFSDAPSLSNSDKPNPTCSSSDFPPGDPEPFLLSSKSKINAYQLNDEDYLISSDNTDSGLFYFVNARKVHNVDNPTVTTALDGPDVLYWHEAIKDEVFKKMLKPGSPSIIPVDFSDIPNWVKVTYLNFILKKKIKPLREDIYKARATQRGDLNKNPSVETYSPTISSITCATLQEVAVIDEMDQALVDTVGAFLAQDYPETLPPLYVKFDKRVAAICGLDPKQNYRVVKYIYGIPDAGKAYFDAYRALLLSKGYIQSKLDPCLFMKFEKNGQVTYAWIHVDDTWVAASSRALLSQFIKDVQSRFEVTVEPVDNYLGVHYTKLPDGSLKKTQPKLLESLFLANDITNKPHVKTPGVASDLDVYRDSTPFDKTRFLSLVGSLLFLLFSRPDIGFAVSWSAGKANAPTKSDWYDLKRVLQFLYQTKSKGLIIQKQPKGCPLQLHIYVDASYLLYPDSKAQSGYSFSLNNMGTFFNKSQKQPVVTTSSSHSEMRAMFASVCEFLFIEMILLEIHRPLTPPTIINEDNQPICTLLTRDRAMPKHSKHFIMLVNYVRELIDVGELEIRKVGTNFNFSDILTKHVQGRDYLYKAQQMLGRQPGEPEYLPVELPAKRPKTKDPDDPEPPV